MFRSRNQMTSPVFVVPQVAASAGHHMWTGPQQCQPATSPHHAQHHDQPGSPHPARAQRMPHLLWAGSAHPLLSLPAQRGLWRWVERINYSHVTKLAFKLAITKCYVHFFSFVYFGLCGMKQCGKKSCSWNIFLWKVNCCVRINTWLICAWSECAHRMKKCIKCQVTITKKIRQGENTTLVFLILILNLHTLSVIGDKNIGLSCQTKLYRTACAI